MWREQTGKSTLTVAVNKPYALYLITLLDSSDFLFYWHNDIFFSISVGKIGNKVQKSYTVKRRFN